MFARLQSLDNRIFDNITRIQKPAINKIMVTASRLGNAGIVWWVVCMIFLIIPKWRYTGLVIIFSIGLTSLMGEGIIKHTVKRMRPCHRVEEDEKLINKVIDYVGQFNPEAPSDNEAQLSEGILENADYLLHLIDNISRTAISIEVPIGILTAIIGVPIFLYLLRKGYSEWS